MNEDLGVIVFGVVVVALAICAALGFASWSCSASWSHSGFQTSWGPIKGCTISTDGGKTFIPESNYRDVSK